jgi:hypothetical protein
MVLGICRSLGKSCEGRPGGRKRMALGRPQWDEVVGRQVVIPCIRSIPVAPLHT